MPYEFFFSYTRGNSNVYLKQFFEDLSTELRQQLGYPREQVVGFFDQQDIELGDQWDDTIAEALQQSKVMVCVYSPGYFKSTYCGKEWQVFQNRREEFVRLKRAAGDLNAALPPVIKPVFWMAPLPRNLDEKIGAVQYIYGDPAEKHNQEGLRYMIQKLNDYGSAYVDYISKLATNIRETCENVVLPALPVLPVLKNVVPLFPLPAGQVVLPVAAPANPAALRTEPRHVRFVFVAADPAEFGEIRSKDSYLESGGRDWRPFANMGRIGPFVQHLVSDEQLDFVSDELKLGDDLLAEVEKALDQRQIVIFIVDRWTLNWKTKYRELLKKFDQDSKFFMNCSVLVPASEEDPFYCAQRDLIDETMGDTFYNRAFIINNPIFFRGCIHSRQEFTEVLREVLIKIKAEMQRRALTGKIVSNQISQPVVSNL